MFNTCEEIRNDVRKHQSDWYSCCKPLIDEQVQDQIITDVFMDPLSDWKLDWTRNSRSRDQLDHLPIIHHVDKTSCGIKNSIFIDKSPNFHVDRRLIALKDLHVLSIKSALTGTLDLALLNTTRIVNLRENPSLDIFKGEYTSSDILQILILTANGLQGSFPSNILMKRRLLVLDLSENSFTGLLPSNIGDLTQLRILNLNKNQFNGALPASLAGMSKLLSLRLRHNSITRLPLANLQNSPLDNHLVGRDHYATSFTSKLQSLDVAHNQLNQTLWLARHFSEDSLRDVDLHDNPALRVDIGAGKYENLNKLDLRAIRAVRIHPRALVYQSSMKRENCQIPEELACRVRLPSDDPTKFSKTSPENPQFTSLAELCGIIRPCTSNDDDLFAPVFDNIANDETFSTSHTPNTSIKTLTTILASGIAAIVLLMAAIGAIIYRRRSQKRLNLPFGDERALMARERSTDSNNAGRLSTQSCHGYSSVNCQHCQIPRIFESSDGRTPSIRTTRLASFNNHSSCCGGNTSCRNTFNGQCTATLKACSHNYQANFVSDCKPYACHSNDSTNAPFPLAPRAFFSNNAPPTTTYDPFMRSPSFPAPPNAPRCEYLASAVFDHVPDLGDEIALVAGDFILVEIVYMDGWAGGTNITRDVRGVFPMACVKLLAERAPTSNRADSAIKEIMIQNPTVSTSLAADSEPPTPAASSSTNPCHLTPQGESKLVMTQTARMDIVASPVEATISPISSSKDPPSNAQSGTIACIGEPDEHEKIECIEHLIKKRDNHSNVMASSQSPMRQALRHSRSRHTVSTILAARESKSLPTSKNTTLQEYSTNYVSLASLSNRPSTDPKNLDGNDSSKEIDASEYKPPPCSFPRALLSNVGARFPAATNASDKTDAHRDTLHALEVTHDAQPNAASSINLTNLTLNRKGGRASRHAQLASASQIPPIITGTALEQISPRLGALRASELESLSFLELVHASSPKEIAWISDESSSPSEQYFPLDGQEGDADDTDTVIITPHDEETPVSQQRISPILKQGIT